MFKCAGLRRFRLGQKQWPWGLSESCWRCSQRRRLKARMSGTWPGRGAARKHTILRPISDIFCWFQAPYVQAAREECQGLAFSLPNLMAWGRDLRVCQRTVWKTAREEYGSWKWTKKMAWNDQLHRKTAAFATGFLQLISVFFRAPMADGYANICKLDQIGLTTNGYPATCRSCLAVSNAIRGGPEQDRKGSIEKTGRSGGQDWRNRQERSRKIRQRRYHKSE